MNGKIQSVEDINKKTYWNGHAEYNFNKVPTYI